MARSTATDTGEHVQLVKRDATAAEKWGVRRPFVRAPDGNVINIVAHRD